MSNKAKNILIIIGFIMVLIIAYKLSISKTLEQKQLFNTLQKEVTLYENIPNQLLVLRQKQKHYDSLLNSYQFNGLSIQNNLLKTINSLAEQHRLQVISFVEPHKTQKNDLTISNYRFTLKGGYNAILQLVHALEQKTKFGEIINLEFEKKKNFKTNKFYLEAHVVLQSFG